MTSWYARRLVCSHEPCCVLGTDPSGRSWDPGSNSPARGQHARTLSRIASDRHAYVMAVPVSTVLNIGMADLIPAFPP